MNPTNSIFNSVTSAAISNWWHSKTPAQQGDIESSIMIAASTLGTVIPMLFLSIW